MERYRKVEKHNFICFFANYLRIKSCLQLNTDDLTWRFFFRAAEKNAKTRFLLKDFLSLSKSLKILIPEKILASHSSMALGLPENSWCKPQNGQLAPKFPIFRMVKNEHGAHFYKWGQNSNAYNLYIVGKEHYSGLILY